MTLIALISLISLRALITLVALRTLITLRALISLIALTTCNVPLRCCAVINQINRNKFRHYNRRQCGNIARCVYCD